MRSLLRRIVCAAAVGLVISGPAVSAQRVTSKAPSPVHPVQHLGSTSCIGGSVTLAGSPVGPGWKVTLRRVIFPGIEIPILSKKTNAQGGYYFHPVKSGKYVLCVSNPLAPGITGRTKVFIPGCL